MPTPFGEVSADIVEFNAAFNGDKYMIHAYDADTNLHFVWNTAAVNQLALTDAYQELQRFVRAMGRELYILNTDSDPKYGLIFRSELRKDGVYWKPTAPYTAEQDPAERAGKSITTVARSLALESNLPEGLWPELVSTAAYLLNRTPTKSLNWKTPFEAATGKKPLLSHIYKIGSRAYAYKTGPKELPKRAKLDTRCHLGYLVGFEGHNIYRIWIPSQRKVIRTRDVRFNEKLKYEKERDLDIGYAMGGHYPNIRVEYPAAPAEFQFNDLLEVHRSTRPQGVGPTTGTDEVPQNHDSYMEDAPAHDQNEEEEVESVDEEVPYDRHIPQQEDVYYHPQYPEPRIEGTEGSYETVFPLPMQRTIEDRPPMDELEEELLPIFKKPRGMEHLINFTRAMEPIAKKMMAQVFATRAEDEDHTYGEPPEPRRWKEIKGHKFEKEWMTASTVEFQKAMDTGTFFWVDESEARGQRAVPLTWVWKYKLTSEGLIEKWKARLCARGDLQDTTSDTYAATLSARIFRFLMALIAQFDLETIQMDAVNAFLNSVLPEPIYLHPPEGFKQKNKLLKCVRALYGFKESPMLWYKDLRKALHELGLTEIADCLAANEHVLVFFFVDDICIAYQKQHELEAIELKDKLASKYEMRILGEMEWFCGIKITRNREQRKLWLTQESYIEKMAQRYNVSDHGRRVGTPLPYNFTPARSTEEVSSARVKEYGSIVGSLNFAAVQTRPDIAFAVSQLARHLTNPTKEQVNAALHCVRYLLHNKQIGIEYGDHSPEGPDTVEFFGASDASFADDEETRRSSEGWIFYLFGGVVDWKAVRQTAVTKSSTEAELYAISHTASELLWWERLFKQISLQLSTQTHLYCDNQQTLRIITQSGMRIDTKMRHVDVQQCWLREKYQEGSLRVKWIETNSMPADGFTKLLSPQNHQRFINQIRLRPPDGDQKRSETTAPTGFQEKYLPLGPEGEQ